MKLVSRILRYTAFLAFAAFLLYGAILRTQDKTGITLGTNLNPVAELAIDTSEVSASVVSMDGITLVLQTTEGEELLIDGRSLSFALQLGFIAQPGDELRLQGFDEDGEFEVISIQNLSNGQSVQIRNADGTPLWSGRGGGGGQYETNNE